MTDDLTPDYVLEHSLSGARPAVRPGDSLLCSRCRHGFHGLPCEATYLCECPTSLEGEGRRG